MDCSPYVNGAHYDPGTQLIWVTWTNRRFTESQRASDRSGDARQQAGANGPENNENLGCMFSDDFGDTWSEPLDSSAVVGKCSTKDPSTLSESDGVVDSRDPRVIVRRIPRDSGIMNQEGQCIDIAGSVHVLMRDDHNHSPEADGGKQLRWKHHWEDNSTGEWHTYAIPNLQPTASGRRGKICCHPQTGDTIFVIPGNVDDSLTVLRRRLLMGSTEADGRYGPVERLWSELEYDGEPLIDEEGLLSGMFTVMTRTVKGEQHESHVVVLEWVMEWE